MSVDGEYKVERPEWCPPGPWMTEPDKVVWKTAAGLPGMIVRNKSGNLCGYVAVTKGHPCYEDSYLSRYEKDADGEDDYNRPLPNPVDDLRVHGGITYGNKCGGHICHVPEPGDPDDVWWLGFDCAHSGDWSWSDAAPYLKDLRKLPAPDGSPWPADVYRDLSYVRHEVESLAEQLAGVGQSECDGHE